MNQDNNINNTNLNTENNNINNTVVNNNTVTPTPIVEPTPVVEPTVTETPVVPSNEEPVQQPKVEEIVEDPKSRKRKNFFLIVLFIFFFSFVMGMPYVNEFVDKLRKDTGLSEIERRAKAIENEQNKEREKNMPKAKEDVEEKEEYKTLKCTIAVGANELNNYNKTTVQEFEYNTKNEVVSSKVENTYNFIAQDDAYQTFKSKCDEDSLKYIDKVGYEFSCSYTDLDVVIGNAFDLETFKPIVDNGTTITANATYKENIEALKERLTQSGYTCE